MTQLDSGVYLNELGRVVLAPENLVISPVTYDRNLTASVDAMDRELFRANAVA